MDSSIRSFEKLLGSLITVFRAGAMICFAAMASTNNNNQDRNASMGGSFLESSNSASANRSNSLRYTVSISASCVGK